MVALARGGDLLHRPAGGLVHHNQRNRLSRVPQRQLARRTVIQPLNQALAAGADHDSRGCAGLEKGLGGGS